MEALTKAKKRLLALDGRYGKDVSGCKERLRYLEKAREFPPIADKIDQCDSRAVDEMVSWFFSKELPNKAGYYIITLLQFLKK